MLPSYETQPSTKPGISHDRFGSGVALQREADGLSLGVSRRKSARTLGLSVRQRVEVREAFPNASVFIRLNHIPKSLDDDGPDLRTTDFER